MDKKLYEQIDEILCIKQLFMEKTSYELLEIIQGQDSLHSFLQGKYDFLHDLKNLVKTLPLSERLRRDFFTKACNEIEDEINEKAIVMAGQKFDELYTQSCADHDEEERITQEYRERKMDEFKMFVNSKSDIGIQIN